MPRELRRCWESARREPGVHDGYTAGNVTMKYTVMSNGVWFNTVPRHGPVNALTMGGIVRDAGLRVEESKSLL